MANTFLEEEQSTEAPELMRIPLFKMFKSIDKNDMVSKTVIEDQPIKKKDEYSIDDII
jgi:hypothetical protein